MFLKLFSAHFYKLSSIAEINSFVAYMKIIWLCFSFYYRIDLYTNNYAENVYVVTCKWLSCSSKHGLVLGDLWC